MTLPVLRKKLHELIDTGNEEKLIDIYTMFGDDATESKYVYDDETINMLEERRTEFEKSGSKGITEIELMALVKKELSGRGL